MSTAERDCEASHLQAQGLTWVQVAERLGLANGGVARRCAMRHRERYPDGYPDGMEPFVRVPNEEPEDNPEPVERVSQTEITINGRAVTPNTEVSIKGETGRFTFRYSLRPDEVTVWGGQPQYEKWRTFKLDRVRTVHRKPRLRKNAEAEQVDA
jgi:hypothetical protein